jgi:predicted MPP superfamily phosphohydrolase
MTPVDQDRRKPALSRRQVLGMGALAGLGLACYGDLNSRRIQVERRELRLPQWDADGVKVAVLADVHLDDEGVVALTQQAVELALKEKPDILVHLGDFTSTGLANYYPFISKAFEALRDTTVPKLAILGNHDKLAYGQKDLISTIESTGWNVLVNKRVEVQGITISGVDDPLRGKPDWSVVRESGASKSYISLVHEPDYVDQNSSNVSLQLSGHSHGGQICLPGGFSVHTPKGARNFIKGFYPGATVPLYVSRGIGTVGPKFRLFCPPEVSILTLRSG